MLLATVLLVLATAASAGPSCGNLEPPEVPREGIRVEGLGPPPQKRSLQQDPPPAKEQDEYTWSLPDQTAKFGVGPVVIRLPKAESTEQPKKFNRVEVQKVDIPVGVFGEGPGPVIPAKDFPMPPATTLSTVTQTKVLETRRP